MYSTPGTQRTTPNFVAFSLSTSNVHWQYLRCHSVGLLVDGNRLEPAGVKHDGNVGRGYVSESITFRVTVNELLWMAVAKKVEGRVCNTEFALNAPEILALRNFASYMKATDPK